jgi:hypothetical protein
MIRLIAAGETLRRANPATTSISAPTPFKAILTRKLS